MLVLYFRSKFIVYSASCSILIYIINSILANANSLRYWSIYTAELVLHTIRVFLQPRFTFYLSMRD